MSKWHNLNIGIKISINSGTALLLFLVAFFGLLWMGHNQAVERMFPVAIAALVGAFSGYLLKQNADNKLDVEAAKGDLGVKLNDIKLQARGELAVVPNGTSLNGKTGDPLQ